MSDRLDQLADAARRGLAAQRIKRQTSALVSMALGTFGVFFLLQIMNADKPPPQMEKEKSSADFQVEQKKPPPEKKPKPKPRPQRQASRQTSAPTPNLGPGLRGASFDLPGFSAGDMGNAGDSLLGDTSKKMAMTEGAVDVVPKPRRRTSPQYPRRAKERGIEGHVRMSIFVDEDGRVGTVRILEAEPSGVFEEAAQGVVQSWEFEPGQYEGEAVGTWVTQTVVFKLQKS